MKSKAAETPAEISLSMQAILNSPGWRLSPNMNTRMAVVGSLRRHRRTYATAPSSELPFPVFRDVPPLRALRRQMFKDGKQVGFVPTMGALHEGHISLVRHALRENTDVFVSIYVNPTQFGVNEDLAAYPRTWDADMKMLLEVKNESEKREDMGKICGIFAPTTQAMYPTLPPSSEVDGEGSFVTITPLGKWLEGSSRPVFFRGVATVCTKLFNAVQPDRVYFGQKDGQQSVLIKRMVKDFLIPTEVRVIPTTREHGGLAMSSRNVYLGNKRRKDAIVLSKALFAAQQAYSNGELSGGNIRAVAFKLFDAFMAEGKNDPAGITDMNIDYIALSRADDMTNIEDTEKVDPSEGAILSAAMYVHPFDNPQTPEEANQRMVRLIDNVILEPRPQ